MVPELKASAPLIIILLLGGRAARAEEPKVHHALDHGRDRVDCLGERRVEIYPAQAFPHRHAFLD